MTDHYYKYPGCIPFLSMWYWPSALLSKVTRFMGLDSAFRLYAYFILAHYFLASLIAYKLLGLFGAITLTYAGYCIKPQTPSFVYTVCWMPGMLIGGWFGAFSCFMAITGGYWPILVYFLPVAAIINPRCLLGIIPALVQIAPFLWYWPRSVRSGESNDPTIGRLPWWKLRDLVLPTNSLKPTSGVHFPEVEMYMGISILFIWSLDRIVFYPFLCCIVLLLIGKVPSIQRIPARALYLLTFLLTFLASQNIGNLGLSNVLLAILTFIQSFLLLRNSSIYPSFPFSQWWDRPSKLYSRPYDKDTWPFFTGYLWNNQTSGYKGAFSLRHA